ncbi:MAG: SagB/ThcOx family dehydrogenase [Nitrospirota bacterium]|nr:SagB/ThcOx family dehydrogenase [Nitrospirota bacterium]
MLNRREFIIALAGSAVAAMTGGTAKAEAKGKPGSMKNKRSKVSLVKTADRAAPSAGALYPLDIYVVAGNVTGLPEGIYKYMPGGHELKMVVKGDRRNELCGAALGQSPVKNGAAVIVFSAVPGRTTVKYGGRGIQYLHIETGHAAQNVLLQAVSLDLGTVVIGAFHDDEVKKVMDMTGTEQPLYIMPVGKR